MKQVLPGKLVKIITNSISLVLDEQTYMPNFMLMYRRRIRRREELFIVQ
jgi:hypothetical protein